MKRTIVLLLFVSLFLSVFSGCSSNVNVLSIPQPAVSTPDDTPVTLHVLTEETQWVGMMNYLLEELAESFCEEHDNVTIEIEYLPSNENVEERTARLEQLRIEIMAGKGPDLYLLPDITVGYFCEELFSDVELSMRNGMFHEISAYYNADNELNKEELNPKIMDAGTIGEARYILPLRYDFPVLLVNEEALSRYGLTLKDVNNTERLMNTVLESGDTELAFCAYMSTLNLTDFFPELIDYENSELLLTQEELATHMRQFQQWSSLQAEELFSEDWHNPEPARMEAFVINGSYWSMADYPLKIENLSTILQSSLIAKSLGEELTMYPLYSSDGSLIANITYWGAVGAGCEYPDVAYDFLREFLTRESQWETTKLPLVSSIANSFYERGVPTRNKGAIPYLVESAKNQVIDDYHDEELDSRAAQLQAVTLDESEIPIWDAEIDIVRFDSPLFNEFQFLMTQTLYERGFIPTDVDIDAMAEEFITELRYLLVEG